MKHHISYLVMGLIVAAPAFAETPSERIRGLYDGVPFDQVRASPQADIIAHIEEMRHRSSSDSALFAVPDLDIELFMRDADDQDVLMNPRVLEAIARMPSDRAAQVLRMIEDRRSGLSPLEDVPPLSMTDAGEAPESLSLRGWALERDQSGAPYIQSGDDAASRVMLVPSMILANFGRVLSIQDDRDGFRVTLESGDVLEGDVIVSAPADLASEGQVEWSAAGEPPLPDVGPAEVDPTTISGELNPVMRSLRPRPRPAGLVNAL